MATLRDDEFGDITIRKHSRSRHIRLSMAPDGTLRASMPAHATLNHLKSMVSGSRTEIRKLLTDQSPQLLYVDGMQIGKSHSLIVQRSSTFAVKRQQLKLVVTLPPNLTIEEVTVQQAIRQEVIKVLRKEASHYLPRRLKILASQLECTYERVRFSHASTRWGSCSSSGTISLNIALMTLPFELIDYVLIHELCHTKQMNHSPAFWSLMESADPNYLSHRRTLKQFTPTI